MLIKIFFVIKSLVFASLVFGSDSKDLSQDLPYYEACFSEEEVTLKGCILTHKTCLGIAEALMKSQKAKSLKLIDNELGDQGLNLLVTALKTNTSLTSLAIKGDKFDDLGCSYLSDLLWHNTPLKILLIEFARGQQISSESLMGIVFAVKNNATLAQLKLANIKLDNEVAQLIADALKKNSSLRDLSLRRDSITDESAMIIAKALEQNNTLTCLDLAHNHFGDSAMQALATSLKKNTTLTMLYINDNRIALSGFSALRQCLSTNWYVRKLMNEREMNKNGVLLNLYFTPAISRYDIQTAEELETIELDKVHCLEKSLVELLREANDAHAALFPQGITNSGKAMVLEFYLCCSSIIPHEVAELILQNIFSIKISSSVTAPKLLDQETLEVKFKSWCTL